MGRYDDIDSPDYNDTNMGIGAYYDSPEEKQIARLEKKLNALTAERDRLAAENAELKRKLDWAEQIAKAQQETSNGTACAEERAAGNGGCGACSWCCSAANATLDRMRGVVPKVLPPHMSWKDSLDGARSILYPPETTDDDR